MMLAYLNQFFPDGAALPALLSTYGGAAIAALALVWCAILQLRIASTGAEVRRLRRAVRGLEAAESQRAFEYMNRIPAESEVEAPRETAPAPTARRFPLAAE